MSAYRRIEHHKDTENAIEKYESVFGEDTFPSYYFESEFKYDEIDKKIVGAVNECLNSNKDVYEMGIVPLSALETCY